MKIGLIIYGSLDILTGGFIYDRKVMEYLKGQGHQIEVITLPWRTYPAHLLDNFSQIYLERLANTRVDIWIQDELNHPSLFLLNRKFKKRQNVPFLAIVHHLKCNEFRPKWENSFFRFIEKKYLHSVDGFIFNSQTTRKTVEVLLSAPKPYCIGYPGTASDAPNVEENAIIQRSSRKGPVRIIFVGSWIPRKELHTLISALAMINPNNWFLEIVGSQETDPAYSAHVHDLIRDYDLSERIQIHGQLTREELQNCYKRSHVLAVPSSYEGFGIVYLEGMSYGLPAIASTTGAAHETVIHGVNGFLIEPGNAKSIAQTIEVLNDDRAKLAQMGIAGLKKYQLHPTWQQTGHVIDMFLQKMAKNY